MTEAQFEAIFKTKFTLLSNIAYSVVKDQDQAKDIVQQVFIRFWDKRKTVNLDNNIVAYLKKAVINTSINHLEKYKRLQLEYDLETINQQDKEEKNREQKIETLNKAIKNAISNLPNKCQTVFSLSKYDGMTNREIADYLEISIKAVEKHKTRALKELRITLKPYLNIFLIFMFTKVGLYIF